MYKPIIIFLLFSFFANFSRSQNKINAVYKHDRSLSYTVERYFLSNYWRLLSQQCIYGNVFVNWAIDRFGNVVDIKIGSGMAPLLVEKCITEALLTTSGSWSPAVVNGKKVQSDRINMNVMFTFNAACIDGFKPVPYAPFLDSFYKKRTFGKITTKGLEGRDSSNTKNGVAQTLLAYLQSDTLRMFK